MKTFYRLTISSYTSKKMIIQKLLLIIAIVLDFVAFLQVINCLFDNLYYLFAVFACLCVGFFIRFISTRLNYNYNYIFNNGILTINKNYSLKKIEIIKINCNEIVSITKETSKEYKINNDKIVCTNDYCNLNNYSILYKNVKYLVSFDNYMYAIVAFNNDKTRD